MSIERKFSSLKYVPGTTGNPLDMVIHGVNKLEKIPTVLFFLLLACLHLLPHLQNWRWGFGLFIFSLMDWCLLALLPLQKVSFGPARPTVLALALFRILFSFFPLPISLPLQGIGTLLVLYGFWIEPQQLKVTYQKLKSEKTKSAKPLRILHLSDLHLERICARELKLQAKIKELQPDLILFSGDFLNLSYRSDARSISEVRSLIQEWDCPLGVFAVTGSPAVDLPETASAIFEGLRIRRLDDEAVTLDHDGDPIQLVGLTCTHRPEVDGEKLLCLLPEKPQAFTILLYHTPDLAPSASTFGIDLQLSGHTHGGQVRLPFLGALVTGSLYGRRFQAGRMQLDGMTLYISRGIGLEGSGAPRVRFLCPPEIILWEI